MIRTTYVAYAQGREVVTRSYGGGTLSSRPAMQTLLLTVRAAAAGRMYSHMEANLAAWWKPIVFVDYQRAGVKQPHFYALV